MARSQDCSDRKALAMDEEFLIRLASASPTPGGGGASAACGALAASLASMVSNLTIGKVRYADVEAECIGAAGRLEILRSRFLDLIDSDAQAFEPLAAAYKLPSNTPQEKELKDRTMQEALIDAIEVPLDIIAACKDVLVECDFLARHGSKMAISDAGSACILAKAAAVSASLNVFINLKSLKDDALAEDYRGRTCEFLDKIARMAEETYSFVARQIDAWRER